MRIWTNELLADHAAQVLREDGWVVDLDDGVLQLTSAQVEAPWPVRVVVGPQPGLVSVLSLAPAPVPADRTGPVARLLAVADAGRAVGWFELDPLDGELHARAVLDVGDAHLDEEQVAALLRTVVLRNVEAMGDWLERIGDVVNGADPDAVLAL